MTKKELLNRIRRSWLSYVNSGGFSSPKMNVGKLEKGGVEHWARFLQAGKQYVTQYGTYKIDLDFLPEPMLKLLIGS